MALHVPALAVDAVRRGVAALATPVAQGAAVRSGRRTRARPRADARAQLARAAGRSSFAGRRRPASRTGGLTRLRERRRAERAATAPGRGARRSSSAAAARGPPSGSAPPSRSGGISCPHSEPAAREIDSFISVPPRSLTPAASACRTPSGPSFTQLAWMFVISGWSASRATAWSEQRLAERRPATRATLR